MPGSWSGSGTEARAILLMIFSRYFAVAVLDTYSLLYCTSLVTLAHFPSALDRDIFYPILRSGHRTLLQLCN
jgi:hypothetical protein